MGDTMPSCELNILEKGGIFLDFRICMQDNTIDPEFGDYDHGYMNQKPVLNLGAHVALRH